MAASAYWYGNAVLSLATKQIDWVNDTIKVALYSSAATGITGNPNQDNITAIGQISGQVGNSGTYTAGGTGIVNKTATYETALDLVKLDGNDVSWTGATITARYAVIYDTTAGSRVLGYVNFDSDVSCTNGTFTLEWNTAGIFTIAVTPA